MHHLTLSWSGLRCGSHRGAWLPAPQRGAAVPSVRHVIAPHQPPPGSSTANGAPHEPQDSSPSPPPPPRGEALQAEGSPPPRSSTADTSKPGSNLNQSPGPRASPPAAPSPDLDKLTQQLSQMQAFLQAQQAQNQLLQQQVQALTHMMVSGVAPGTVPPGALPAPVPPAAAEAPSPPPTTSSPPDNTPPQHAAASDAAFGAKPAANNGGGSVQPVQPAPGSNGSGRGAAAVGDALHPETSKPAQPPLGQQGSGDGSQPAPAGKAPQTATAALRRTGPSARTAVDRAASSPAGKPVLDQGFQDLGSALQEVRSINAALAQLLTQNDVDLPPGLAATMAASAARAVSTTAKMRSTSPPGLSAAPSPKTQTAAEKPAAGPAPRLTTKPVAPTARAAPPPAPRSRAGTPPSLYSADPLLVWQQQDVKEEVKPAAALLAETGNPPTAAATNAPDAPPTAPPTVAEAPSPAADPVAAAQDDVATAAAKDGSEAGQSALQAADEVVPPVAAIVDTQVQQTQPEMGDVSAAGGAAAAATVAAATSAASEAPDAPVDTATSPAAPPAPPAAPSDGAAARLEAEAPVLRRPLPRPPSPGQGASETSSAPPHVVRPAAPSGKPKASPVGASTSKPAAQSGSAGRHQRILAASSWPELRRFAVQEKKALDVSAAAALLARLPFVLQGQLPLPPPAAPAGPAAAAAAGTQQILEELAGPISPDAAEARALAADLAALLTLQLPSLPPSSLAAVISAVGELRAPPRWALWPDKAISAVERATARLTPQQLARCALGLARMRGMPSPTWLARLWTATAAAAAAGRLDLHHLACLAEAAAEFRAARPDVARPPGEWLAGWLQAVEATARPYLAANGAALRPLGMAVAARITLAAHRLGVGLPPEVAAGLLEAALPAVELPTEGGGAVEGNAASQTPPVAAAQPDGWEELSGPCLAGLADALAGLGAMPSARLLNAYVLTLWGRLYQLQPAMIVTSFNALSAFSPSLPPAMLARVLALVAVPGPASRTPYRGALSELSPHQLAAFVIAFYAAITQAAAEGGSPPEVDASALRGLQLHLSSLAWKDLNPGLVVALLTSLVRLATFADSGGVGVGGAPGHALEPSVAAAAYSALRTRVDALSADEFSSVCSAMAASGQVDMELVEAFITRLLEAGSGDGAPPSHTAPVEALEVVMRGLGELAGAGARPRPGVLGPLLAACLTALPGSPAQTLVVLLNSMAQMKLAPKDTQGVRVTMTAGIPTPGEVLDALLGALAPQLPQLSAAQLAGVAGGLVALGHTPEDASFVPALVDACEVALPRADVRALMALLVSLPALAAGLPDGPNTAAATKKVETFKRACVDQIGDDVSQLSLEALAELMSAVASSKSSGTGGGPDPVAASFATSALRASKRRMATMAAPPPPLARAALIRLAAALAAVGAAPPAPWLEALQAATLDALASAPEAQLADLAWAVGKLALARREASPEIRAQYGWPDEEGSDSDSDARADAGGILPSWREALEQRVTHHRLGQSGSYPLPGLARLMWGCAALGVTPRQGLLNTFAGKSMDRLSVLEPQAALDVMWAMAVHGTPLNTKWLNQWASVVQGGLLGELTPTRLAATLWALSFHALGGGGGSGSGKQGPGDGEAPAPRLAVCSAPPPAAILSQLSARLGQVLTESSQGANPPLLPATQVVELAAVLASLRHTPDSGTARLVAEVGFSARGALSPGVLVALLWATACFSATPKAGWLEAVVDALQPGLPSLGPAQLSRLLWALASLPAAAAHLPSSFLPTCVHLLSDVEGATERVGSPEPAPGAALPPGLPSATPTKRGAKRGAVTLRRNPSGTGAATLSPAALSLTGSGFAGLVPGDAVDATWALVRLGAAQAVPQGWWELLPSKLINRMGMLTAPQVSNLLWAAAEAEQKLSPELSNEMAKAAATRFASVPAPELADLVFSFARLRIPLPPAFASSSVRRLQSSMAGLAPRQLARMLWSFGASGFTFLPQQLEAYEARIIAACPSMGVDDLALVVGAFPGLQLTPSDALLSALEARSLALLEAAGKSAGPADGTAQPGDPPASDPAAAVAEALVPLLLQLTGSRRALNAAWLAAWGARLPAAAAARLPPGPALQVLFALTTGRGGALAVVAPDAAWCAALLRPIVPAVPALDSRQLLPLLQALAVLNVHLGAQGSMAGGDSGSGQLQEDFAAVRASVLAGVPDVLAAKLSALDTRATAGVLVALAALRMRLRPPLLRRLLDALQGATNLLPDDQIPVLCQALEAQVQLTLDAADALGGSDADALADALIVFEMVRPLQAELLQPDAAMRLDAAALAACLAHAAAFSRFAELFDAVAPDGSPGRARAQLRGAGVSAREAARRAALAEAAQRSGAAPASAGKHRPVILATQAEREAAAAYRQRLLDSFRKEGADELIESMEHLPLTFGNVCALWLHDWASRWQAAVTRGPKASTNSMQDIVTGLAALSTLGLAEGSDTAAIVEAAAVHLPYASVEHCCSLAGVLARAGVKPEPSWVELFMASLTAALAEEAKDASTWALAPRPLLDLTYALSFWAPSVTGGSSGGGLGDLWGRSAKPFPVDDALGAALLRSASAALQPAGAGLDAAEAASLLRSLCLLSAAQRGQGVVVDDAWLQGILERSILPACAHATASPVVALSPGSGPASLEEAVLAAGAVEQGSGWRQGLDLQGAMDVMEGLVALGRGLPAQPAGLLAGLLDVALAGAWAGDAQQPLLRVLVALYKLRARPPSSWLDSVRALRDVVDRQYQSQVVSLLREAQAEKAEEGTVAELRGILDDMQDAASAIRTWLETLRSG